MKTFIVNGINYNVDTDGAIFTIAQEGQAPMFTQVIDQAKAPAEAMGEVIALANTFLVGQFPGLPAQFDVAAFLAIFETLVITVIGGVPVISIP